MILGSEVGILDIDPENIRYKTRLEPGKIFLIDFAEGRIVSDEEFKRKIASAHPYAQWLEEEVIPFERIANEMSFKDANCPELPAFDKTRLEDDPRIRAFNLTEEQLNLLIQPMVSYKHVECIHSQHIIVCNYRD